MTFGLSGAALAGIAVGGATLVSGLSQADAAKSAASTQAGASAAGIEEQRRQFEAVQKLLAPYVQAGTQGLSGQQALLGLAGPEAEQAAIQRLQGGETFRALTEQGENAILQRASPMGGLRGGNIQAALAQFRPQLLAGLIEQQYGRLGGLSTLGQNAAAGVGTAGMTTGSNIGNLLAQQGAAQAGGQLAAGRAFAAIPSAISGGLGIYSGLGGKF
jgi:hypothetical protein